MASACVALLISMAVAAAPVEACGDRRDGNSSNRNVIMRSSSGQGELQVLQYCDFRDFVQHLGIEPHVDASGLVMVAAHHMFASSLPPSWSEQVDESSSRVYFFNRSSGESLWSHPQEEIFKELIEEVRCWRPDLPLEVIFARSDAHLRKAHSRAAEAMSHWSGPYDVPQGPEEAPEFGEAPQFYYNSATAEIRWVDPRQSVEFDLRQRHTILCECIAAHTQTLAKMAKHSDSSEDEDERSPDSSVQAFIQNLWESLGTLPLPVRQPDALPTDAAPPNGIGRPAHLPAGDDTVRSSMSYLTARSTVSQQDEVRGESSARGDPTTNHPFVLQQ